MLRSLLADAGVAPASVADVVIGNAVGGGGNVARLAALEAGLPVSVPGVTVDRQCGSGLDAIALAARLVAAGGSGLYLAGGVESISTAPLRARRDAGGGPEFFARAQFAPLGLGDPDMGVAAENVAARFGISRERQDELALRSHRRALASAAAGVFDAEIVPLAGVSGPDGSRTVQCRRRAAPRADRRRAGPVPSGVRRRRHRHRRELLLRRGRCRRRRDHLGGTRPRTGRPRRTPGARARTRRAWTRSCWASGRPRRPNACWNGVASPPRSWGWSSSTRRSHPRPSRAWTGSASPPERANLDGGALALGHAYGASGAVLVTRLLAQARRNPVEGQLALAMISIAGGMGTAALLEYRSLPLAGLHLAPGGHAHSWAWPVDIVGLCPVAAGQGRACPVVPRHRSPDPHHRTGGHAHSWARPVDIPGLCPVAALQGRACPVVPRVRGGHVPRRGWQVVHAPRSRPRPVRGRRGHRRSAGRRPRW